MSSKLYFQDDSIQLIEISSEKSSQENINKLQSPSALTKHKKNKKIDSSNVLSTNLSISSSSTSKMSDIFIVKSTIEPPNTQLKPIPAPRRIKPAQKPSFKENSASTSIETQENVRKSSETIDTISGSIFSQRSETLSYKEKLRNRFLTVKRQAESSIIQKDKTKINKKKKIKEAVEAILQNEESQINTEINKYEQHKSDWNTNSQNSYDFFCKVYESEDEINKTEDIIKPSEEIESEENVKQSVSEFIGIDNLDIDLVEYVLPNVLDFSIYEKSVFKLNTNRPKKKSNELNFETRNLEEEGIYMSEINHVSKYQLRILEDLLLCDEKRDWFGADGQLKILPDPRLKNSFKPVKNAIKHSDFVNKYTPPTLYEPAENTINIYENTLELVLHEIKFKYHALFSQEHVLEQKLIHLYDEYKTITSENVLMINIKKLEALRCAKSRLEEIIKQSGDCSDNQLKRYKKYLIEIKNVREKIFIQGQKERTLKKSILFIGKSIKNLRKTQKYSSTSIKLIITKETVDFNNETKIWEQNLAQGTSESLEELENNFESEMSEYKTKVKQWKQKQTNDDEVQSEISSDVLGEKPKKPKRNFSEEQISNDILERMDQSLKPPGEPNLEFDLNFENQITENVENIKEKLRRNDVLKTKIFIKILYNNREICRSKTVLLSNNFICNFNEQLSIQLYKIPNNLHLEIYEQNNTISKRLLGEISLIIPVLTSTIHDVETQIQTELFKNTGIVTHNHSEIGTGVDFDNIENEKLFSYGALSFNLWWTLDKNLESLLENTQTSSEESSVLIPTLFDIENLENWISNYPDPLDPKNALFFDYVKNLEHKTDSEKNYFRVNPDLKPFEFCSIEELENNSRFKLLKLRFNNEPEFKGIIVPNRLKEIPADIFTSYEKRRQEEIVTPEILTEQFREENNIDTQRKWAKKYLQQAENRIIQLSKIAEKKISLKDVLNEEIIPSFGSLGLSFMNWLQPKRPLRPTRKQIKSTTNQISFKELNILVNIIGAIQVPSRKDFQTEHISSSSKHDQNYDYFSVVVRPFVTVSFREECARTTVADGPNPIWNQELNLAVRYKNDKMTVQSLQNTNDSIVVNLYDESVDDLILDDRIRDRNIHQQLGCNWLGNLEIPFSTLLFNNRIEGTFKINLPSILLGYERQNIKTFQETGEPFSQKIDTFLTIFVTLQPSISNIDRVLNNELECTELQYVEEFITNWQTEFNDVHPQRKFSSFVTTLNGEKSCITRYFKEIRLPELTNEDSDEITELQIAKYVSLIPFRENGSSGLIPDIWLNPEQLLTLMMGTIKDHAVLLTCYFLTLGLKAWFLLGYGLIDGYTAYVLVRKKTILSFDYFIYDVKTGKKYNVYDNNCPLQKVFCVVNDENVWANIQEDDRIHQTRFDFTKSCDWLQLFNKDLSAPTNLQQINVTYYDSPSVLLLQERIEKKLRKKIMKWRKFSRTTFNHYSNIAFKKILAKLEEKSLREINYSESPEHFLEIQNLLSSYQIRGFAKCFPYTNISDLVEFVQKTGVHLNDNPNIEFSLSVYAHSYNNNTVNIWLFIATLIRNR